MVVCVLGLLMVPGALVSIAYCFYDYVSWVTYYPSFKSIIRLLYAIPLLWAMPAAAVSFVLLMVGKSPKACAVLPILGGLSALIEAVIYISEIGSGNREWFQWCNCVAVIVLGFLTAVSCVLTIPGSINPKLSWMALALPAVAIMQSLRVIFNMICLIVNDYFVTDITDIFMSIFTEYHIFFFFGIAVFLYGRWKKKQAELSV